MLYLKLILRNLTRHPLRSFLTLGGVVFGFLLLCILQSVVVALEYGVKNARSDRLWVQSAVSLYVDLPLAYEEKIAKVGGIETVSKFQWFGGIYKDPANFFGQFAVDPAKMLDMYPEVEIVDGSREAFLAGRTTCIVGQSLVDKFAEDGWKVGATVPLLGALFPHPEGKAWEFQIAGIYKSTSRSFDESTLFFHWDYFEKTMEASPDGLSGVGTFVFRIEPGTDVSRVMRDVDGLFQNGPQRVQTTTEAEFQAQFASMIGNVPFFVAWIGGAVLLAILVACINTMLVAANEQVHDMGIVKALGFSSPTVFGLLLGQSLFLCGLGGILGVGLAKWMELTVVKLISAMIPAFTIDPQTVGIALVMTVGLGLVSGIVPAWRLGKLGCVDALGARE